MDILQRAIALNEQRKNELAQLHTWVDDLDSSTEMSAEERAEFDRRNASIDAKAEERDVLMQRAEAEKETLELREAQTIAFGREPDDEAELRQLNTEIRAFIRGEKRFDTTDDDGRPTNAIRANVMAVARERELLRMGVSPEELRAIAWDTGSVASAVPTILDRQLYQSLEENIAALRMPTTRINTTGGEPMDFPKVGVLGAGTQVSGQGTLLAGTDPGAFGKLTLTPVKYGQLVKVASEVVSDSGVDIVGFVARDVGRAIGRSVNTALMATMTGSVTVGSAGTVGTGGSLITPTFNNLVDLEYSVNDAYRSSASAGWLTRDKTAGVLRKLRDGAGGTEGAPLWQPSLQGGIAGLRTPDRLFGYPVFSDVNVASCASNSKVLFFGDWSAYFLRMVGGGVMVERNDSVGFDNDEVHFRGKARVAGNYQDLNAVNLLKQSVS